MVTDPISGDDLLARAQERIAFLVLQRTRMMAELESQLSEIFELRRENTKLKADVDQAVNMSNTLLDRCLVLTKENDKLRAALEGFQDVRRRREMNL